MKILLKYIDTNPLDKKYFLFTKYYSKWMFIWSVVSFVKIITKKHSYEVTLEMGHLLQN